MSGTFVQELEPLSREDRIKRTVELGRRTLTDESALHILTTLSYSSVVDERWLGALGLRMTKSFAETERLLKDPHECIASLAIEPATKGLPDSTVLQLFEQLPARRLQKFCAALTAAGRAPALVDKYLQDGKSSQRGGPAQAILCWASESCVASHYCKSLSRLSQVQWQGLAKRCPTIASDALQEQLSKSKVLLTKEKRRAQVVFRTLNRYHPAIGLKLLESVIESDAVTDEIIKWYARIYPVPVAQLVLKTERRLSIEGKHFKRKITEDVLVALWKRDALGFSSPWLSFPSLSRAVQSFLYAEHRKLLRDSNDDYLYDSVVMALPPSVREKEAMIVLDKLNDFAVCHWTPYLAALPFPRALDYCKSYLKTPDVRQRAHVCKELVSSGNLYPEHLNEIIDFCIARENECDSVRRSILLGLCKIRAGKWRPEEHHFEKLVLIIRKAEQSKDLSHDTLRAAMSLVICTAAHTNILIDQCLSSLAEHFGFTHYVVRNNLPVAAVERIWGCLLPLLAKLRGNSTKQNTLETSIYSFGSRLRDIRQSSLPFLRTLCDSACPGTARFGFKMLFKHFRPEAIRSVPELLRASPDWITLDGVRFVVCKSLQGPFLDPYLKPICMQGMFVKNTTPELLVLPHGSRWTAKKQMIYAESIIAHLSSPDHDKDKMASLVKCLSTLSSANFVEALTPYIQKTSDNARLCDLLIQMMGKLRDSLSMEVLIDALGDKRARVAIYAIRQRVRGLPSADVISLLRNASRSASVTVQKEAIRIIGEVGDEAAYSFLQKLFNAEPLHEDAHIAWLRAMWAYAEKPEVWEHFSKVAQSERYELATAVLSIPTENLVDEWQHQSLGKVMSLLLAHPDERVVVAAVNRLIDAPLPLDIPEVTAQLARLLKKMDSRYKCQPILALMSSCTDAVEVSKHFCDLQNDEVLMWVLDDLKYAYGDKRERVERIAASMIDVLVESGRQPAIIAQLITLLPPEEWHARLKVLLQRGLFHPGTVCGLLRCLDDDNESRSFNDIEKTLAEHRKTEERLRRDAHPLMRRIGLGLLCYVTSRDEWGEEDVEALKEYRQDNDRWVSEEARVTSHK